MSNGATQHRLADLHAQLAGELSALLNVDAGVREVLITPHHTRLRHDLDETLDPTAGLRAILPDSAQPAPSPLDLLGVAPLPASDDADVPIAVDGAAARLLMSLDSATRLAIRSEPILDSLAAVFALTLLFTQAVDAADHFSHRAHRLAGPLDKLRRDVSRARALAIDLAPFHAEDPARTLADSLAGDLRIAIDLDRRFIATTAERAAAARDLRAVLRTARARALGLAHALDLRSAAALPAMLRRPEAAGSTSIRAIGTANAPVRTDPEVLAADLARARHDFTTADLRSVDLTQVSLTGVRWSDATEWPSDDWRRRALHASIGVGTGVYMISDGASHFPARTRTTHPGKNVYTDL